MSKFWYTLPDGRRVLKPAALNIFVPDLRSYGFTYAELEQLLTPWTDPAGLRQALNIYDNLHNQQQKKATP